jgi:hypothetical protein
MTLPDLAAAVLPVAATFALSLAIAWTHRHTFRGTAYTQDYAHTLVIIATVTAVLVKVIGANLAIGLAMFAAFSVIRFPRNLGQSSDLAFMFFAIAVAMVAGIVSPGTAAIVTAVGCGLGLALHHGGFFLPATSTHLLTLSLASDADFETMLGPVLGGHAAEHRLLGQRLSPDGSSIELRYALALKPDIPTARFIEALHLACGNRRLVLTPAGGETD